MKAYDEIPTAFDVQQKLSSLNLVDPAQQAANAQADPSQSQPGMLVKDIEDLGKYLELKKNPDLLPLSFEVRQQPPTQPTHIQPDCNCTSNLADM